MGQQISAAGRPLSLEFYDPARLSSEDAMCQYGGKGDFTPVALELGRLVDAVR
eukprot:SAG11_NODE_2257_length_3613_cov_1.750996_4_plen_53_part_00